MSARLTLYAFLLSMALVACSGASDTQPDNMLSIPRADAQSALVNLNVASREVTLTSIPTTDSIFTADVGNPESVSFTTETDAQQSIIALSNDSADTSASTWALQASTALPISFVIDTFDSTLTANLTDMNVPRFDLVTESSTIDLQLPADDTQLALDSTDSTVDIFLPTGSNPSISQITSNSSLLTLNTAEGVRFDSNMVITGGALTLAVPVSTGVQVTITSTDNGEISLPMLARIPAEAITYQTENYATSTAQINLTVTLDSATLRITQTETTEE
ncbi:MAG: hypothetical protein AAFV98_12115 [Chloroflexota bacterium]